MQQDAANEPFLGKRFRGFLPVVVDVETGGFDCEKHALLEIAVQPIEVDHDGRLYPGEMVSTHVEPFPGSEIDPKSLEVTGIIVDHPFRFAKKEREALNLVFAPVREALRRHRCQRAILVGHNAAFDLAFLNAAVRRTGHKRNPFHPFSTFDTVTLGGMAYGQTVLSRAVEAAGMRWDQAEAHSAVYDTDRTARLFCNIINRWHALCAAAPGVLQEGGGDCAPWERDGDARDAADDPANADGGAAGDEDAFDSGDRSAGAR